MNGKMMQDRQCECGSLTRSGLGDADHVTARHDGRDRPHLDRGWNQVLFLREGSCDGVVKSEIVKASQSKSFFCARYRSRCVMRRAGVAGRARHPARSGLSVNQEKSESEAVERCPYTRLAASLTGCKADMGYPCVRFKAEGTFLLGRVTPYIIVLVIHASARYMNSLSSRGGMHHHSADGLNAVIDGDVKDRITLLDRKSGRLRGFGRLI